MPAGKAKTQAWQPRTREQNASALSDDAVSAASAPERAALTIDEESRLGAQHDGTPTTTPSTAWQPKT